MWININDYNDNDWNNKVKNQTNNKAGRKQLKYG
jgi:hypothetical protein